MRKREILNEALQALRWNPRRTFLTLLGMAWGIATVVLLLAYGNGFGTAVNNIFTSYGSKAVGIFPGRTSLQVGGARRDGRFASPATTLRTCAAAPP
jgi:putative ABC transport system permease protein